MSRKSLSSSSQRHYNGVLSPDARWWCYIGDSNGVRCLLAEDLLDSSLRILVPALYQTKGRDYPNAPAPHFCLTAESKCLFIGCNGKIHRIDLASVFEF